MKLKHGCILSEKWDFYKEKIDIIAVIFVYFPVIFYNLETGLEQKGNDVKYDLINRKRRMHEASSLSVYCLIIAAVIALVSKIAVGMIISPLL